MNNKQREVWNSFILAQRTYLTDDIEQLQRNLRWRKITAVDCVELLIAEERLNNFNEFVRYVNNIFTIQ